MNEKESYIILLIILGVGAFVLLWSAKPEQRQRGTITGIIKGLVMGEMLNMGGSAVFNEPVLNRRKRKLKYMEAELYESCVILKNLAAVQKENPLSADLIYQVLMDSSKSLKPVYGEILTLYRQGKDDEANKVLPAVLGKGNGKYFGLILSRLDSINPAELREQMELFLETLSQERMTAALKRSQRNSLVSTVCSVSTVFALFVNFAVVIVFMDTLNMLKNLF